MATATLEMILKATDQASAQLARVSKQLEVLDRSHRGARGSGAGLGDELQGLGRTAAAVALGMGGLSLATTGLRTSLQSTIFAAAENAASIARLQTAVEATGKTYRDYSGTIDEVIKKGQALAFSDNQTRSALSILTAQTDSITEATKRYAIAQNLARGANIDVVTASRLLGRITDENVQALKRYGVTVSEVSTESEALAAVQKKFAGQAEAFAASPVGVIERARDAMREAGESLGRLLLPSVIAVSIGLTTAADRGAKFADSLGKTVNFKEVFSSLGTGLAVFSAAVVAIKVNEFAIGIASSAVSFSQLAVGVRSVSTAMTLLSAAGINPAVLGIVALGVAFAGIDFAVRKLTGGGLLSWLTGATHAHNLATAAARSQGVAELELALLRREGVADVDAKRLEIDKQVTNALKTQKTLETEIQAARARPQGVFVQRGQTLEGIVEAQTRNARERVEAETKQQVKNIQELELNYQELSKVIRDAPSLGPGLANDLKAAAEAAGAAVVAMESWTTAIETAKKAQAGFGTSLADLQQLGAIMDPQLEALKLQQIMLESTKTLMGDAFGEKRQAELDNLTRRIELLTDKQQLANQSVALFGARVQEQYGAMATQVLQNVGALVTEVQKKFGTEEVMKLKIVLPDLVQIQAAFQAFIKALRDGATVDIALRFAAVAAAPSEKTRNIFEQQLPGESNESFGARQKLTSAQQKFFDEWTGKVDALNKTTSGPLGSIAGKAAAAGKAISQAESDLVALSKAFAIFHAQTGLGIEQFMIWINVQAQRIELDRRGADVALQLAVQQALVADSGFQLQKALVSVQEWMLSTGRTAEAFSLESVSAGLRDIQSQLDATFNRPTKETLQLSLQRAELEKRRLLILQSGASSDDARVKAIDLELQGLDNLISLRKTELDIMRIHAQLADETVLADIDQVTQIRLLTSAVTIASQQVEHFGNIVAMQAFAMVGFTAQQKAYINAVARLKGEEEPYPGFAMGIKRVPYDMIAKVHKDERITSAQENMALINGRSGGSAAPSLTIAAGAVQVMVNGTPDRPQIQELREELMHALEEFAHENDMRGWAGSSGGGIPV